MIDPGHTVAWREGGFSGAATDGPRNPVGPAGSAQPQDMARWLGDLFADEARRPPSGVTGFDSRLSPIFAGRKPGF